MDLAKLKSFFLRVLIGCLAAAGTIAVTTVLTGSFNDVFGKALLTIVLVAVHALVSFGYIDLSQKDKSVTDLTFFHNTTFVLIILSFITSIFAVWGVISPDLTIKLYSTYFILLFAVLHGETLSKMVGNDSTIDGVVHSNYAFMMIVIFLILPVIYISDASSLGDMYYRILAAFGIIDAILTLTAVILNKLYLQKHPKVDASVFGNAPLIPGTAAPAAAGAPPKKGMSLILILLITFIGIQLLASLILAITGRQAAKHAGQVRRDTPTTQTTTAPVAPQPSAAYSYESSFTYSGYGYTCTRNIAGTWSRNNSNASTGQRYSAFIFTPANTSDLNNFCTPH